MATTPISRREMLTGAAGLGLLATLAPVAVGAQEAATPIAPATHPVVGFWALSPPAGHVLFNADGTYIEVNPHGYGSALGVWQPTGTNTVTVLLVFPAGNPDAPPDAPEAMTIWFDVEVAGDALAGPFTWQIGTDSGAGFVTGKRLTLASVARPA